MAGYENRQDNAQERAEVTIKFGKGLMGEPFISKNGKELVEIKIPNADRSDSRPWESFVVPANFVHENQYGKGMWIKLPENGVTKISRNVLEGQDASGRNIWGRESREVTNKELKALVETYKTRDRGSVMTDFAEKRAEMGNRPPSGRIGKTHDDLPLR